MADPHPAAIAQALADLYAQEPEAPDTIWTLTPQVTQFQNTHLLGRLNLPGSPLEDQHPRAVLLGSGLAVWAELLDTRIQVTRRAEITQLAVAAVRNGVRIAVSDSLWAAHVPAALSLVEVEVTDTHTAELLPF